MVGQFGFDRQYMVISMLNSAICGECTFPDLAMCVGFGGNCGSNCRAIT